MGSMQGKARPSTGSVFWVLGMMINHVCCRGYCVFTVVVFVLLTTRFFRVGRYDLIEMMCISNSVRIIRSYS